MAYQMDFDLGGRKYQVRVNKDLKFYHLLRRYDYGITEKIPCMTDTEERKYPKGAAWVATAYLQGLRDLRKKELI